MESEPRMKLCAECVRLNPDDAKACVLCGGTKWRAPPPFGPSGAALVQLPIDAIRKEMGDDD